MAIKFALAVLTALSLQACAVYVPPVEAGGLVFIPAEVHQGHGGHHGHHRGGHDRDEDRDDD